MQWYYARDGEQVGPLSAEDFHALVTSGEIGSETLVWREGLDSWLAYGALTQPGARPVSQPRTQSKLRLASRTDAPDGAEAAQGGSVAPAAAVAAVTGPSLADSPMDFMYYAGFWIRFVALIIDQVIVQALGNGIGIGLTAAGALLAQAVGEETATMILLAVTVVLVVVLLFWEPFFLAKWGATPGKMVVRLKVVRPNGDPIGFGRAFCRTLVKSSLSYFFMLGYITAAWDDEKRTWHDRICDTRVVRR